ncbi:MAG: caspase family protein, partial [Gammaproteobacteria bacterium]|nr:caspase family protein [Gammaproteobacteria bacterium]
DTLKKVDYARNDAQSFKKMLEAVFPYDRLDARLLLDEYATSSSIEYELKSAIGALEADDLFVFYYAGHGFHGVGGNRLTGWDTNPHHIEGSTVQLREALFDCFDASNGSRLLAFVDACARGFKSSVPGRDVVSDIDPAELRANLSVERYAGVFLSCEPGQASYPADVHRHGAWTYFLLQALRGDAEDALDRDRYLTDRSLRDYLAAKVPAFLRAETEFKGQQRPRAIIDASRTFAFWQFPEVRKLSANEFSDLRVEPEREYFEAIEAGDIVSLPGYIKKVHFIPDRISDAATGFVRERLKQSVIDEMQGYYDLVKETFGLRRRELSREDDLGQASLSTDNFRFTINAEQHESDPASYVIIRQLEIRDGGEAHLAKIDEIFGDVFDRIVVRKRGDPLDFDELVEKLEDIVEAQGGTTRDEPARSRVYYVGPDNTVLTFDTEKNWVRLSTSSKRECADLLARAQQYRFGTIAQTLVLRGMGSLLRLPDSET